MERATGTSPTNTSEFVNENITKLALMQEVQNIPAKETADDILPQFIRV